MQWNVTEFTLLGITYSVDLEKMQEINYDKALKMGIKDTSSWKLRKITPIGKIVIIKSLISAKINHMLSTLPNPTEVFIKKIEHLIFKLLWNDKPDKIKRAIVTQHYHEGGLKMPNFEKNNFVIKGSLA